MANFADRVPQNVRGKFYVDSSCIYCELCVRMDPGVFKLHNESDCAFVFHQPTSLKELGKCLEALVKCPTKSIGNDGDTHNWNQPANPSGPAAIPPKPWWKLW